MTPGPEPLQIRLDWKKPDKTGDFPGAHDLCTKVSSPPIAGQLSDEELRPAEG